MYEPGTFNGGISIVQKNLINDRFNYTTGIYYVNFTPFSFLEGTLRETLISHKGQKGFQEQDRSSTLRIRPLKEGRWWPAVVIGANDFYSYHGASPYQAYYAVMTKHLSCSTWGSVAITIGYLNHLGNKRYKSTPTYQNGLFGGFSYALPLRQDISIKGEWDTRAFNCGVHALLFKHLGLMCFTREFKGVTAGIYYHYTIKY